MFLTVSLDLTSGTCAEGDSCGSDFPCSVLSECGPSCFRSIHLLHHYKHVQRSSPALLPNAWLFCHHLLSRPASSEADWVASRLPASLLRQRPSLWATSRGYVPAASASPLSAPSAGAAGCWSCLPSAVNTTSKGFIALWFDAPQLRLRWTLVQLMLKSHYYWK
jgi:hypothetical protein